MRSETVLTILVLAAVCSKPANSQPAKDASLPARAEVLVLGTYHMSNPGRDLVNTEADDVLTPRRQAEIEQVLVVLEKFRPTKIAVEAGLRRSDRIAQRYSDYLAGAYELTRNEVDQLGLRLARKLNHETVYSVDVDGDFPYHRLANYAKGTGRQQEFDAINARTNASAEAWSEYLAAHSVLEALLYLNAEEQIAESLSWYFEMARFGEDWDWPGADLVADWFRRNMRIYSNILQLLESPDERVLVIYGAGHLGWLQFAIEGNPSLRLRTLAELAR